MDLRDALKVLIRELAGEELRSFIREVMIEELMGEAPPRVVAARKAVATRRANTQTSGSKSVVKESKRAKRYGVAVGQKYRGKPHNSITKNRVIEIVRVDERFAYPRILKYTRGKGVAKKISFESLLHHYDKIVSNEAE